MNYGDLRARHRFFLNKATSICEAERAQFGSGRLHLAGERITLPEPSKGMGPNVLAR